MNWPEFLCLFPFPLSCIISLGKKLSISTGVLPTPWQEMHTVSGTISNYNSLKFIVAEYWKQKCDNTWKWILILSLERYFRQEIDTTLERCHGSSFQPNGSGKFFQKQPTNPVTMENIRNRIQAFWTLVLLFEIRKVIVQKKYWSGWFCR